MDREGRGDAVETPEPGIEGRDYDERKRRLDRAVHHGGGIHVQGGSVEEVRANVKAAVDRYLDDTKLLPRPKFIRLRFVRDEVIEA